MRSNVYIFKIPFQLSFLSKFKMSFGMHNWSIGSKLFEGSNSKWVHWDSKIVQGESLISLFDCKMQNGEACYLRQEIKDNTESKIIISAVISLPGNHTVFVSANQVEPGWQIYWFYWEPTRSWQGIQEPAEDMGCLFQSLTFEKGFTMRIQEKPDLVSVTGQALEHAFTHTNTFTREKSFWALRITRRKQGQQKVYMHWKATITFNIYN